MSQNNQFPGQNPQGGQSGGQQFPQQGQPQGGQQYGQQFPQQGGQPFPQQGGQQYPQQGGQQYPQQGQPQGGQFGQQPGGYPPAGQFGQQPGGQQPGQPQGGQFGQRPPGGGGGFQQQPGKPKSNGMVIGIVIVALVAVGLLGWLLMSIFGGQGGGPTPSPSPVISTSGPDPSPSPSTSTSPDPSPSPSPSTSTTAPSGDALEVGLGVSVTPADGWEQASRDETKNLTVLTNGGAALVTQAFRVQGNVTGKQIADAYLKQITEQMTGVQSKPAETLDVKSDRLSVGIASWTGTRATSQGSAKYTYVTIMSVRDDGLTVMSTLVVTGGTTVASAEKDYLAMTNSLLNSQLKA